MTDEMEAKAENCRLAMKAAMEAIQDYCGIPSTGEYEVREIEVRGIDLKVPDEICEIAMQESKSLTVRQTEIEQSEWVRDKAAELCTDWWGLLTRTEPTAGETDGCINRLAAEIGARILEERGATVA